MAIPRSEQIDLESTQYYHCMNRCVRGSFLCGENADGTINYDHRKSWIVSRIKYLSKIFSIKICAYGVMSNHYHLVLYVDQNQALNWSDDEVHQQWAKLYPKDAKQYALDNHARAKKIKIWRERLSSISWYMRCLNEPISRLSNKEDDCKGHFWEGRFKSQALLDEGALLSAMAYVDLNPIRAGIAITPETSDFTSIQERLLHVKNEMKTESRSNCNKKIKSRIDNLTQPSNLLRFSTHSSNTDSELNFKLSEYIDLVEETGRVVRDDKLGAISSNMSSIFERLGLLPTGWLTMVQNLQNNFSYVVGGASRMFSFTRKHLNSSPKGVATARYSYQT